MRSVESPAGLELRVTGGQLIVEVRRAACPPGQRPCGDACPFQSEATVARHELQPQSARFRPFAEQFYCEALLKKEIRFRPAGAVATIEVEIEAIEGEAAPADPRPVRHLVVSIDGYCCSIPNASWCCPFLLESRTRDATETDRVAPRYWADVRWSSNGSQPRPRSRRGRMPILRVGRQVRAGGLPTSGEIVELDQPAGTQNGETTQQRPMIQVVWHDLEGLEAARKVAAQEASREMAFLLLGNPRFCDESYTAFTEVQRVIPVSRYEVSNAAQASISPEAFAEAKVVADAEGLNLVGVLHSHVVEAAEESSQACGLFYSSTDAEDHAQFLPSAWSIGGVLNVRVDGSVQTAVFARSFEGYFAPLEKLVAP